jgi:outer membrane protein assembly factor BamB
MASAEPWHRLPSSVQARPVLDRGRLIVGTIDGGVHALDPLSGERLWSARVKGTSVLGVAVVDDLVVATVQWGGVSTGKGIVFAADVASGRIRWERRADAAIGTGPCLVPGAVLFGTQTTGLKPREGTLFALEPTTGETIWARPGPAFERGIVVVDGALVAPAGEGALICTELASGTERWRIDTEKFFSGPPAIADGAVYIGGFDGILYAASLADGSERWRVRLRDPWVATPYVADGVVHVGSWDESQYALEAATGRTIWRRELEAMVASSPVPLDGRVCVACHDQSVRVLDRHTGAPVWAWQGPRADASAGVITPPVPDGDRLLVTTRSGQLFVLDAATGLSLASPLPTAPPPVPATTTTHAPARSERAIGMLSLPTKRMVVCDPISDPHTQALDRALPPGPHPVFIGVEARGAETLVRWLEVRIDDAPVVEWRAPRRGPRTVGVDSARVALLDRSAAEALVGDPDLADRLEALYTDPHTGTGAGLWTLVSLASSIGPDVAACVTGLGDGEYPVRYGLSKAARVARVRLSFIEEEGSAP